MDSSIPLSRDQLIPKTIMGGMYYCMPPVGDYETQLIDLFTGDEDNLDSVPEKYEQAKKEIDKSLEGKDKPSDVEYEKMISDKVIKSVKKKETKWTDTLPRINKGVDFFLKDMDNSKSTVEWLRKITFPKDNKPSSVLPLGIKRTLYDWYSEQFLISVDEAKN